MIGGYCLLMQRLLFIDADPEAQLAALSRLNPVMPTATKPGTKDDATSKAAHPQASLRQTPAPPPPQKPGVGRRRLAQGRRRLAQGRRGLARGCGGLARGRRWQAQGRQWLGARSRRWQAQSIELHGLERHFSPVPCLQLTTAGKETLQGVYCNAAHCLRTPETCNHSNWARSRRWQAQGRRGPGPQSRRRQAQDQWQ